MKLKIIRQPKEHCPTLGLLFVDGKFFCHTLEDEDRLLTQDMPILRIGKIKVYGQTAIPYGKYSVQVTMSPRFKRLLPAVTPVKGFVGIRIHAGNTEQDSLGCILVGFGCEPENFQITESGKAENALVKILGKEIHQLEIAK